MSVYVTWFVQLLLIVHVLRTGRSYYWIWLLIFLPVIGGVAYLAVEVLPEYFGGIAGRRLLRGLRGIVDPGSGIRAAERAYEQSPNAENARRLSEELLLRGQPGEAERVVREQLLGMFEHDPLLLHLLAQAQFSQEQFGPCVDTLETLRENNPGHGSAKAHLLYARALDKTGRMDAALDHYRAVSEYFPGAEARLRYCLAQIAAGREEAGRQGLEDLLRDAKLAPGHYRISQKQWLLKARKTLRALKSESRTSEGSP